MFANEVYALLVQISTSQYKGNVAESLEEHLPIHEARQYLKRLLTNIRDTIRGKSKLRQDAPNVYGRPKIVDETIEEILKLNDMLLSEASSHSSDDSVSGDEQDGVDSIREVGVERRALPAIGEGVIQAMPGAGSKNGVRRLDARFLQEITTNKRPGESVKKEGKKSHQLRAAPHVKGEVRANGLIQTFLAEKG